MVIWYAQELYIIILTTLSFFFIADMILFTHLYIIIPDNMLFWTVLYPYSNKYMFHQFQRLPQACMAPLYHCGLLYVINKIIENK